MQTLLVLGPSGAGKSHFGRWLSEEKDWLHLEIDQFPLGSGIDIHFLRSEWERFVANSDPTPLRAALERRPWERSPEEGAGLAAILGAGGRRVFLERDLREIPLPAARAAFQLALGGLRRLRDGEGLSPHALVLRLARALRPQPA